MNVLLFTIIAVPLLYVAVCAMSSCYLGCEHWVYWWESSIQKRDQIREAELGKMAVFRAAYEKATAAIVTAEIVTHHRQHVPV